MISLKNYGYTETEKLPSGLIPGRVTELRRERFTVITELGEVKAVLKGAFYHHLENRVDFPCVGDFVSLHYNENGDSLIVSVLPRHSMFSRADYSGHDAGYTKGVQQQVVATNFDFVFILSSMNKDFNINRIMRYVTQARQSGGQPVILLTKADLIEDYNTALDEVKNSIPDIHVHAISSHIGLGLNELDLYLISGKTIVFLGMSGVGKSSLLNTLLEDNVMKVQSIREVDSRGRHTTTHRQLFMLPTGTMVIDTPGMRELGLYDASKGIRSSYSDVEELFSQCHFRDCTHQSEPGCAINAALESNTITRERWNQYVTQQQENKYVQDKASFLIDKRARNKKTAMWIKESKKKGNGKYKY